MDDLDLTVARKGLGVRGQAGSVPAVVTCTQDEIIANQCNCCLKTVSGTKAMDACAIL